MLRFFRYNIPFKKPFEITNRTFETRQGIFLTFRKNGITAFGEVAPLPGFSSETLAQTEAVLIHNQKHLESLITSGQEEEILSVLHSIHHFPSLSFGLDTLVADFRSQSNEVPISEFLFGNKKPKAKCNFTIGIQNNKELVLHQIEEGIKQGFDTAKMKVGTDFKKEHVLLSAIREHFPELTLRIDANQAWEVNEAIDNLNTLIPLNIEYCEQPVNKDNLEGLKKVTEDTEIPIAADEAVTGTQIASQLIKEHACDLLIIKPALLGRFHDINVTKHEADTHSMEVVFTTSLDATIGRTMSAVLASGLGSKEYAHGLATSSIFSETKNPVYEVANGEYIFPTQPGLGRTVDLTSFKEVP